MKKSKIMRTSAFTLGVIMCAMATGACTNGEKLPEDNDAAKVVVSVETTGTDYTVKNGYISFTVAKDDGSITSVKNVGTSTDFINGSEGGNFAFTVVPGVTDPFKANHKASSAVMVSSRGAAATVAINDIADGKSVNLKYNLSFTSGSTTYSGIKVEQNIMLVQGKSAFDIGYKVDTSDASGDFTIVNFTAGQLSGLKNKDGKEKWSLMWPYKEGKIYPRAIDRIQNNTSGVKMVAGYPVPFSMQTMQLFNENEALDFIVKDSKADYKEFNFGKFTATKEYDNGIEIADQISMSATLYPYIVSGNEANLPAISVGVSNRGSFYGGLDRYREFMSAENLVKAPSQMVDEWTGMSVLIATSENQQLFGSYLPGHIGAATDYKQWISDADKNNIHTLCAIGWNEGGFEHNYPDYEFNTAQGGAAAFRQMADSLHAEGDTVISYINGHIADPRGNWSQASHTVNGSITVKNIEQCGVKKVGFDSGVTTQDRYTNYMYFEGYGGGLNAYAMCPGADAWQDAIDAAAARLRNAGGDGIWFDQIMEMPAELCYDSSHNHATPATAFSEGYKEMFRKIEESMAVSDSPYLLSSEGVCDAYTRYIDVCGMMWARKLGSSDRQGTPSGTGGIGDGIAWHAPITRYGIQAKILGLEGAGTTANAVDEFARAYLMGEPILGGNYQDSVSGITGVYTANPDIYLRGRYMDARGLRLGTEDGDVLATVILGKATKTFGVQLYNQSDEVYSSLKVIIDLADLGLSGKIVRVQDIFTGETLTVQKDNSITITLNSLQYKGFKVTYE